jgi:hypothetical protein
MYVIKAKSEYGTIYYINENFMFTQAELVKSDALIRRNFCMDLDKANKLVKELVLNGRFDDYEYASICRVSTYEPYPETEVVYYREFKRS